MQANESSTKMVSPNKSNTKMVKIKTLLPIRVQRDGEPMVIKENQTVEVTEEEASMFCDKAFAGRFNFSGERFVDDGDASKQRIVRAVRV